MCGATAEVRAEDARECGEVLEAATDVDVVVDVVDVTVGLMCGFSGCFTGDGFLTD